MRLVRGVWLATAIAAVAVVGWAGYMWVRDLSLLRVKDVTVEGVSGREAAPIRRALTETARRMTTLHVSEDDLEQAVDSFPVVRSVSASAGFPNSLHITVNAYTPVAALKSGDGRRVAVSGDGTMLKGVGADAKLPVVSVKAIPPSRRLTERPARVLVEALGVAPRELRPLLARAYASAHGIRIEVRNGPVLAFGPARRFAAKWAAAVRVLADPGSSGARLIDVRLPERPSASGSDEGSAAEAGADLGDAPPAEMAGSDTGVSPAQGAGASGASGATPGAGATPVATDPQP